ncbi:SEC-C motif-containing protein [Halanaerobium saccharolyticum]|uniref:SEC-C motif-containing protein n=1 Tax=Halanaerobium saccharolyticum TaxID=43595 RepID=A0A4R7Z792_9FIRM|nr:SEC-C metal-binding domain-containing protein [Halanaerobium saccharolyticum]RAK12694.1 SEC-C motif-containing protein [Halanaerobium saccharolyticum]TDW05394.1 SEC-C motif-containing protein [Halanaerobium saccharolyticum]TDX62909.1 SEC-C motif-containing protein [Halanaerobium saccharolyticum]
MNQKGITMDFYSEKENLSDQGFKFKDKAQVDFMTDVKILMEKAYDGQTRYKLYEVGRNDPCPCGSGKKYKKCCARLRAKHSEEYYLDKLSETNDLDKAYEVLIEAEKNHPLDIGFILELMLMSGKRRDLDITRDKLLKLWRLLGMEMGENLVLMLIGLLLEKNELDPIEEIEKDLQPKEINNPDLLLLFSLFNMVNLYFDPAVQYLEAAFNRADSPQKIEVLQELMYYFYQAEKYEIMFDLWLNNFETLNKLIDQHGLKNIPLVSSLRNLLRDSFGFESNLDFNSKNKIREKADIFLKLHQNIEAIDDEQTEEEIKDVLTKIETVIDEISFGSTLYLMLLEKLIGIEQYTAAEKYIEKAADFNQKNSEYLMFKARLNYYLENLTEAEEDINQALKYYSPKTEFEKLTLMTDKLLILMGQEDFVEVVELLKEIKVEAEIPIISALAKGLSPHPIGTYVKLFKNLIKLELENQIDQKKLYIGTLYNLFVERDMLGLSLAELRDDFEEVLAEMAEKYDNQLAQMAEIYLKSEQLSEEESLKELAKINQRQAEFTEEAEIKFEYNLKIRNYDYLLEEKYFAEEKNLLQPGDFAFYKMVALLNREGLETALDYLTNLQTAEGMKIFQRMMQEGESFLKEERLLEDLKNKDIF